MPPKAITIPTLPSVRRYQRTCLTRKPWDKESYFTDAEIVEFVYSVDLDAVPLTARSPLETNPSLSAYFPTPATAAKQTGRGSYFGGFEISADGEGVARKCSVRARRRERTERDRSVEERQGDNGTQNEGEDGDVDGDVLFDVYAYFRKNSEVEFVFDRSPGPAPGLDALASPTSPSSASTTFPPSAKTPPSATFEFRGIDWAGDGCANSLEECGWECEHGHGDRGRRESVAAPDEQDRDLLDCFSPTTPIEVTSGRWSSLWEEGRRASLVGLLEGGQEVWAS